jgi:hypothetical protein
MSRVQDPFDLVASRAPDPFAPPPKVVTLRLDDADEVSRPTPSDLWLELQVRWGGATLASCVCAATSDIVLVPQNERPIGAALSKDRTRLEVLLPSSLIGETPVFLVSGASGHARVLVPPGASGRYREGQGAECSLASLLSRGTELPLLPQATFELEAYGLSISIGLVKKEKPIGRGLAFDRNYISYLALSASTFGGLFAALAYFTPPLGLGDESAIDKNRLVLVQHYLSALAQREEEARQELAPEEAGAAGGEASAPAPGKPGEAGKPEAERKSLRIAVKGPRDQPNVELSSQEIKTLVHDWGMIGLLNSAQADDAPFSAFARDQAIGHDDLNARGNLWGMDIGEAGGQNGLYLSGTGFGGMDGPGSGVGIAGAFSGLGTLGQCDPSAGEVCRFGTSVGKGGGTHRPKTPTIRTSEPTLNGRLPREVVQRIVRQNFGRFRFCYEQGLAKNPSLEGRVAVRFVIDRAGAVSTATAEPGGLSDQAVSRCVAQGFLGLSFPPPEGGIVTVSYPIMLSPG